MYRIQSSNHETVDIQFEKDGVLVNGNLSQFDLLPLKNNHYHLILNGYSYNVELIMHDRRKKIICLSVNGREFDLLIEDDFDLLLERMGIQKNAADAVKEVLAPMPGLVLDVLVSPGQAVEEGQPLIVLEAMKMENVIKSPCPAIVGSVPVNKQDKIDKDQILVQFAG